MNNKNNSYMVLLLILIGFYCCNCNGQASTNIVNDPKKQTRATEMALLINASEFVADAKYADILDEELIKVVALYSILNKVPIKEVPIEEIEKILVAVKAAGLSNKTRSMDFSNDIVDSNKSSSLSSAQKILVTLACLSIIGACGTYIYKEIDRQYKEYKDRQQKEALKQAAREAFRDMGDGLDRAGSKVRQWGSDAYDRVSGWWKS